MNNLSESFEERIPISFFDHGNASQAFRAAKESGVALVLSDDDEPECILLSPEVYEQMLEELDDARLGVLCASRMADFSTDGLIPAERVFEEYGIAPEHEDIEFE